MPACRRTGGTTGGGDGEVRYASRRTHRGVAAAEFRAKYWPTGPASESQRDELSRFLTERYCLYAADGRGRVYRGEIDHPTWPLQPAEADIETNTLVRGLDFDLPDEPPHLRFARRLDVHAWSPTRLGAVG